MTLKRLMIVVGLLVLAGCSNSWHDIEYVDAASLPCTVQVDMGEWYTPPTIAIVWDGKVIYSGKCPGIQSPPGPTGMPLCFMNIHTSPGSHSFTLISGGKSFTRPVRLDAKQTWYFELKSGDKPGEVGLDDFGNKPPMRI